ncbi:MAG TPA: efflux RND transporter permease subunit [Alphaproteobacteria bacterium]|nr:efflux RND transporter permease subunit [Alphaproteobacteria bacterium]
MNISTIFINRPVATTLLTLGVALAGIVAFFLLPVAPLPQVDFPTISVEAKLPGASPETMATSVATPLERHLGQIADVTEMTSTSEVGSTGITLQFGLDRDIDGAARDVQAAINAARADLPASLKNNPTYRKVNPADAPIMILALTSKTLSPGQMYDAASTVLEQKISQIGGIGEVMVGGSSLPAVRAELNPHALFNYGIGLEDVRAALAATNAHSPKGYIEDGDKRYQLDANDQAREASQYQNLIVAYRNGAPVRLGDVADVSNSVEDLRHEGLYNGEPAVLVILFRQPGANIIQTVDQVKAALPQLRASLPAAIALDTVMDRTTTIRASLRDVEETLLLAIALVIGVVFVFLRDPRATLIPAVAVPVSLTGTFGVMYLLGYSLDNLSLMALIVATGFVVDDAIVVLENTARHIEAGMPRREAATQGAREVGFTVLSMSLSLIAVFTPILLMGGIVGRLFREFAVTLSIAILISLIVSLTTTPMMCARLLLPRAGRKKPARLLAGLYRASEWVFTVTLRLYDKALGWALRHGPLVMLILFVTIGLNFYLFTIVPKGFFPEQDTGRLMGFIQADQSVSFQLMEKKLVQFVDILRHDPAVENVVAFTGGDRINSARAFIGLKPLGARPSVDKVISRLRRKLAQVAGATLFMQPVQDIHIGGRMANAEYQYTLQSDSLAALREWGPKLTAALKKEPGLTDVNSDQQDKGLETDINIDRNTASRLGLKMSQVDNTLYDAFGQRQVSVIYNPLNQYHVVMEVAPQYWQNPDTLKDLYVSTSGGAVSGTASSGPVAGTTAINSSSRATAASVANDTARNLSANSISTTGHGSASSGAAISTAAETMVPLSAFASYAPGSTPLAVNHQGHFAATTISFNLPSGKSLSDATALIARVTQQIHMPSSVHGSFAGSAAVYQQSLAGEPLLILAALIAVYIVLGMLYESYVHPVTILSTLPSAGVGAVLALMICRTPFTIIALIGVILLIGIVKKNAIMMIDFAIHAEREEGLDSRAAIKKACLLRFRPIMMTTMAALFGVLPLALGAGNGAELRRPLGISIVGGLMLSQALTLFTTPVIYLYLDRFRLWCQHKGLKPQGGVMGREKA